jgi:hypothetical protein
MHDLEPDEINQPNPHALIILLIIRQLDDIFPVL